MPTTQTAPMRASQEALRRCIAISTEDRGQSSLAYSSSSQYSRQTVREKPDGASDSGPRRCRHNSLDAGAHMAAPTEDADIITGCRGGDPGPQSPPQRTPPPPRDAHEPRGTPRRRAGRALPLRGTIAKQNLRSGPHNGFVPVAPARCVIASRSRDRRVGAKCEKVSQSILNLSSANKAC
jgi:hypothetical protein